MSDNGKHGVYWDRSDTYWVCEDCSLASAGWDSHEVGRSLEHALSLIPADDRG